MSGITQMNNLESYVSKLQKLKVLLKISKNVQKKYLFSSSLRFNKMVEWMPELS